MQAPIASLPTHGESKLHQVYRKCAHVCVLMYPTHCIYSAPLLKSKQFWFMKIGLCTAIYSVQGDFISGIDHQWAKVIHVGGGRNHVTPPPS